MTTAVALGIDIGTSGVRIAATDENNALKAMSSAPIVAPIVDFGRAWQDPQLWWNATLAAFAGSLATLTGNVAGWCCRRRAKASWPRASSSSRKRSPMLRCAISSRLGVISCDWICSW